MIATVCQKFLTHGAEPLLKGFSPSPRDSLKTTPDRAKLNSFQTETSQCLVASPGQSLNGSVTAPGDKSLSHRAVICGAIAVGETTVRHLLESDDVAATIDAMRHLGAIVEQGENGIWRIRGVGVGGFRDPVGIIDFGNSGTSARLVMGAMSTTPITAQITGDDALCRRPMGRVLKPLAQMGARWSGGQGEHLPLTLIGAELPVPIVYRLPVPSAQVKSAVLLAALNCAGRTSVIEPEPTRDHTERMLQLFGAHIDVSQTNESERQITITGHAELKACALSIPGDPSSAAFLIVATLLVPNSHIIVKDVLINPLRMGLYDTLSEMGAVIDFQNKRETCGEIVADLHATSSTLTGVEVPAGRAPSMIDEYPILAVAAAFANGHTKLQGLGELRVKESDRLTAIADGLRACGITVHETPDSLVIEGAGSKSVQGGAQINSHSDHRIAMSFLTLGLAAKNPVTVDGAHMIATSFPQYTDIMHKLGADITRGTE